MKSKFVDYLLVAVALALPMTSIASTEVTVESKASVWQVFGHSGSDGNSSTDAVLISLPTGSSTFQFSVTGGIQCAVWTGLPVGTPDGLSDYICGSPGPMNTTPMNGLSGVVGDRWFGLLGVFTSEVDPYGGTPPAPLPFSASAPTDLSPGLHQVFYIGDGRAGLDDPTGAVLKFTAPPGATRLYLGFYDGYGGLPGGYHDNGGSMTVMVYPSILVGVDVKPGSDPNCFNINDHGVVPVAVLGSAEFDVTTVDPYSLQFGGMSVRMRAKNGTLCGFEDANFDGYLDLVCHFEDDGILLWDESESTALLTGMVFDGTPIYGTDTVCVVPR